MLEGTAEPMTRPTQISERQKIKAFFRDLLRGEAGVSAAQAETLAERCARRVKRVVVWDLDLASASTRADTEPVLSPPPTASKPSPTARGTTPAQPQAVEQSTAFDPYAFSAVVVLTKTGKDGLLKRLSAIDRAEHLKKLADAQHLAIDRTLDSPDALRHAIIKAAEQRIADRRAAAS
ncbi:MAG: hypothetical protein C0511_11735 [Hyphomicrobium sp.]|nr:hypothetical protein [Hyphomicrobium sp.]PPC81232.1 MAG: hypothetical protein CTY40_07555 [Hyphomicrobium sp.]